MCHPIQCCCVNTMNYCHIHALGPYVYPAFSYKRREMGPLPVPSPYYMYM